MLLAKYADKSFDDLVNRKCAEHSQMKLHRRLGISRFPVAKESIYPQTSRPASSGILGLRSPAPSVINIKERPNYSGGMPIENLNEITFYGTPYGVNLFELVIFKLIEKHHRHFVYKLRLLVSHNMNLFKYFIKHYF